MVEERKMRKLIFALLVAELCSSSASAGLIKDFVPIPNQSLVQNIKEDPYFDQTSYSECIVESAKQNGNVSIDLKRACELLATPKRCRGLDGQAAKSCFAKCSDTNYFTRTLGECSVK